MRSIQGSLINTKYIAFVSKNLTTHNGKFYFFILIAGMPKPKDDEKFPDHKQLFYFDDMESLEVAKRSLFA